MKWLVNLHKQNTNSIQKIEKKTTFAQLSMKKCSLVVIKQMLTMLISQATAKSSSIYYIFLFFFFFCNPVYCGCCAFLQTEKCFRMELAEMDAGGWL